MPRAASCLLLLLLVGAAHLDAKSATATRFDVTARVLPGGTLEVVETMSFTFDGSFDQLTRQLRGQRTDGIEVIEAGMDGTTLPFGRGRGQVEVTGDSNRRVRWRFAGLSGAHTFQLTYLVRGAVYKDDAADVLTLRLPGGERSWDIERATVMLYCPIDVPPALAVHVRRGRVAAQETARGSAQVTAEEIRANGWIEATVRMPRGAVAGAPPSWQVRQERANALALNWILGGATLFAVGLIGLFALRQRYDAPPRDPHPATANHMLPDTLPPALAGALLHKGGSTLEHAMATLLELAQRGHLGVEPQHGRLGTRSFVLTRPARAVPASTLEGAVLDIIFKEGEHSLTLGKARGRAVRGFGRFKKAVGADLARHGLIDADRKALRDRVLRLSVVLIVLALSGAALAALLIQRFSGWPMLVPATLGAVSLAGFILAGTMTPLSNDAVSRAARWGALKNDLKGATRRGAADTLWQPEFLPYAVALGLASEWSSRTRRDRAGSPGWFPAADDPDAFAAFVAAAGAGEQRHAH